MKKRFTILTLILTLGLGMSLTGYKNVQAGISREELDKQINALLDDPAIGGRDVSYVEYLVYGDGTYGVPYLVVADRQKYERDKAAITEAVDKFYNENIEGKIPEGSDDWRFKREMEIIKFMVENIDYVYGRLKSNTNIEDDYSAYGALINHEAVCSGYAKCFNLLARRCGLESVQVSSGSHAWNIVRLDDGNYYHVDVCWEDPITDGEPNKTYGYNKLRNEYINLTSDSIRGKGGEAHSHWDHTEYQCNADIYGTEKVNRYFMGIK